MVVMNLYTHELQRVLCRDTGTVLNLSGEGVNSPVVPLTPKFSLTPTKIVKNSRKYIAAHTSCFSTNRILCRDANIITMCVEYKSGYVSVIGDSFLLMEPSSCKAGALPPLARHEFAMILTINFISHWYNIFLFLVN